MAITVWQRSRPKPPLLERFGKTIRDAQKDLVKEPIPKGWGELIKRLGDGQDHERDRSSH